MENAPDFRDGLRVLAAGVRAGDDEFGLRGIQVRTPVRHHSIRAVRRVSLSPVTNGGVVRRLDWEPVHGLEQWIVGRKTINAVWKPGARRGGGKVAPDLLGYCSVEFGWQGDQAHGALAYAADRHVAAARRRA